MIEMNKNIREGAYTAPLCIATDIRPEGVLCSSIDNLGNEFDYVWGTEE